MRDLKSRVGGSVLLAAALGAMLLPSPAMAAHEPTCANAFASGNYNVIIGSGTIVGTSGDDLILGSAGADNISGGGGNDVICGRGGADVLDGGNGNDLVLGDVCDGCESIPGAGPNGDPGSDTVRGGNSGDTTWGDEGDDSLSSGNGDDTLIGGNPGGDGDETDSCNGGRGTDTAIRCDIITNVP